MATQTDPMESCNPEPEKPTTQEKSTEVSVAPQTRQVRHRASNTDRTNLADKETNTRPRGVQVSITYGGDEQVDLVDSYLSAIKDLEESGAVGVGEGGVDTFANMDNLTRARLRRKLKERWSTVEIPDEAALTSTLAHNPPTLSVLRRFSDHHY